MQLLQQHNDMKKEMKQSCTEPKYDDEVTMKYHETEVRMVRKQQCQHAVLCKQQIPN
ncbi:uncharacterized protein V6R79_024838 [Siganus canaliculatus]